MTTAGSPAARDMVRRLLAREAAGAADRVALATGLQRVCTRVSANLRRSVGEDGYAALLARAMRSTAPEHGILTGLYHPGGVGIRLDAVPAHIEAHGDQAVTAALEALVASLIDVLGSLIGMDMVWSLLADDSPHPQSHRNKENS